MNEGDCALINYIYKNREWARFGLKATSRVSKEFHICAAHIYIKNMIILT